VVVPDPDYADAVLARDPDRMFHCDTREAKAIAVVYPTFCGDCRTIEARALGGSIELRARVGLKSVMSGSASSYV
jgi:hypothetical protein